MQFVMLVARDLCHAALFAARLCRYAAIFHRHNFRGRTLREGLYKVEFHTVHGTGTGVIYAINGKLRGGNSAFAFIGNYADRSDGIHVKVTTERHNPDPAFKPLFGIDRITVTLKGADNGDMIDFEGTALQLPGVTFRATLTRISD
jgi:T3SS negative regulator,GrlR